MCLRETESVDCLLVICDGSHFFWISILSWFDFSWLLSNSIVPLFQAWIRGVGSARGRIMWKPSFFATILYMIYREKTTPSVFYADSKSRYEAGKWWKWKMRGLGQGNPEYLALTPNSITGKEKRELGKPKTTPIFFINYKSNQGGFATLEYDKT